MEKIIQAGNLTKVYGEKETSVTALDNIDVQFNENEFTAIMGPSGSGKSTMIRCINRLEEHQEGSIVVDGIELTGNLKILIMLERSWDGIPAI